MLWDSGVPHGSRYKRSQFSGGSPRESPVLSLTVYRLPRNDDENPRVRNGFRRGTLPSVLANFPNSSVTKVRELD